MTVMCQGEGAAAPAERRAYTITDAAALYSVSPDTIRRAIHRTEPPFLRAKRIGGRYRVSLEALEEWWRQLPDA